ncbi:MAG: glycosyltransferase family 1 protein [Bacteroidia bacterium]|nr:MAG: glycosyltransferase family 1 protein [Bacteroidia bacterium]
MKIAINTRLLLPGKLEGIGWFTFQSFKRIVKAHPEHRFYFLFDRKHNKEFVFADNIVPVELFPPARHPFLYYVYFEHVVSRYLRKEGIDLFVSPDGFLAGHFDGAQLPVFHDLNFMHQPQFIPWLTRKYYHYYFPRYAGMAKRIATVSEYSKKDIEQTFSYPAERIDVVYNGIHSFLGPAEKETARAVRDELCNGAPYFVYIGALHRRKNIDGLLRAFDLFKSNNQLSHKLVIIGATMFGSGDLKKAYRSMQHQSDVVFAGRKDDKAVRDILGSADALLLVSHFEGFGVPIIEAMKCEVPVIASDVTSMPEVAGDAALLVDPLSIEQIAGAMSRIIQDHSLRNVLIERGRKQCRKFSWDLTAKRLWESMEKCL